MLDRSTGQSGPRPVKMEVKQSLVQNATQAMEAPVRLDTLPTGVLRDIAQRLGPQERLTLSTSCRACRASVRGLPLEVPVLRLGNRRRQLGLLQWLCDTGQLAGVHTLELAVVGHDLPWPSTPPQLPDFQRIVIRGFWTEVAAAAAALGVRLTCAPCLELQVYTPEHEYAGCGLDLGLVGLEKFYGLRDLKIRDCRGLNQAGGILFVDFKVGGTRLWRIQPRSLILEGLIGAVHWMFKIPGAFKSLEELQLGWVNFDALRLYRAEDLPRLQCLTVQHLALQPSYGDGPEDHDEDQSDHDTHVLFPTLQRFCVGQVHAYGDLRTWTIWVPAGVDISVLNEHPMLDCRHTQP